MNKKKRIILVVLPMLVVLSFTLSLVASASAVDSSDGWFKLELTNTEYVTDTNAAGIPYLRFYNVFSPYATTPGSTTELYEVVLMSKWYEYDNATGSGTPLYYSYAPVSVNPYMSMPRSVQDGRIVYFPYAVLLGTSESQDAGLTSDVYDYNFSFAGDFYHCRFAISLSNNGKDLTVLYNPNFFTSASQFLGAYNSQTDFGKLNDNDTGIILIHSKNPALENNLGYQDGYNAGYDSGYNVGFDAGSDSANSPIGILFSGVNSVLSIKLFGDVTLGLIVYSALGLGALFVVMKMFSK